MSKSTKASTGSNLYYSGREPIPSRDRQEAPPRQQQPCHLVTLRSRRGSVMHTRCAVALRAGRCELQSRHGHRFPERKETSFGRAEERRGGKEYSCRSSPNDIK